jgi:oxygen-dependent protoporphyrinogen oxidase
MTPDMPKSDRVLGGSPLARRGQIRAAVVGGGITGIAAATRLQHLGCQVDLLERGQQIGGRVGFDTTWGREIAMGGKNIGRRYTEFRKLINALGGATYEPFGISTSRIVDGQLVAFDSSRRVEMIRNFRQMCELRDLVKIGRIARRINSDDKARFLGSSLSRKLGERYDALPLSQHFGTRAVNNLIRPITVRINGAEPSEVYLGNFPTNLGMILDTYDQIPELSVVLNRIRKFVRVRCNAEVQAVDCSRGAGVQVRVSTAGAAPYTEEYDVVALCAPAHAAAPMLEARFPQLAALLSAVSYFQSTTAVVKYHSELFGPNVRAIMLDGQPCSNVGCYGIHDRATVRYTFSGKLGRLLNPTHADIVELVDETEAYLAKTVRLDRPKRLTVLTRHWPQAYCGYLPHSARFLTSISELTMQLNNIALAGDYMLGTSLEACCRSGEAAADRLFRATQ